MVWVLPVEDMQDAVANFEEVEKGNSTEFEYQQKNGQLRWLGRNCIVGLNLRRNP